MLCISERVPLEPTPACNCLYLEPVSDHVRHSRESGNPGTGPPLFSRGRRGPTQPDRMMLPRTVQQEQQETAKEQRAIWLFSQSVDPRQPRISAEDAMQLADN